MDVFNQTGLAVGWVTGKLRPPRYSLTFVVKGTFTLRRGARCAMAAPEDRLPLEGDRHRGGDPSQSLVYDSDFALFKPAADVLFVGTAYPALGEARPVCNVGLTVGALSKEIAVFGDRFWPPDGGDLAEPTPPQPFTAMPLSYERSFGGAGFDANPVGRGREAVQVGATRLRPLPNLEDPARLLVSPSGTPTPTGFGPIDRRWPSRATSGGGTYDDAWLRGRWPGLPVDFDFRYFQAAPVDQRIAGYLRGDEELSLTKLHCDVEVLKARLPGLRVRCFVRAETIREVELRLDTLWIDGDDEKVVLVWRGSIDTANPGHRGLSQLLLVTEDLAQPPLAASDYHRAELWQHPVELDEPKPLEPPASAAAAPAGVGGGGDDDEVAAQLAKARELLRAANLPADVVARLDAATRPDQFLAILSEQLPDDPGAAERLQKDSRARMRALFVQHGHDPALLDALDEVEAENAAKALTREQAIERAARRGSFAGAVMRDVDLCGIDFTQLDLRRADLRGARLVEGKLDGADLSEARLEGCDLHGASLSGAIAAGARFAGADLTGADLTRADLSRAALDGVQLAGATLVEADLTEASLRGAGLVEARLDGAELGSAVLDEAVMHRASCAGMRAVGASLARADLEAAKLDHAELSECGLTRARFVGASLKEASLYRACADEADLTGADLTGARASEEASFVGSHFDDVRGDGAMFMNAKMRGASFRGATLIGADFSEADLEGADFHRAILKQARFAGASLRTARLTLVNLFRGSLERADLTAADCRGSSLYGCELLDAVREATRFEGTNLKATKLAAEVP